MPGGFPNKPKILRGAFVEYGLSLPPLVVVFQFNPLQLTRNRSLTYAVPNPPTPPPARREHNRASGCRAGSAHCASSTRRGFADLRAQRQDRCSRRRSGLTSGWMPPTS